MSEDARLDEEQATARRARVLGLDYFDTSAAGDKPLYKDLLSLPELYELKVIPVKFEGSNLLFGVTTTTSQQTMADLAKRFADQVVKFTIISDVGYREYMHL
jgi:hypothetical protein